MKTISFMSIFLSHEKVHIKIYKTKIPLISQTKNTLLERC